MHTQTLARLEGAQIQPPSAIEQGRAALAAWQATQPDNFFACDAHFRECLQYHWGAEQYHAHEPRLSKFGAECATVIDAAARSSNLDASLPRLDLYSPVGVRVEEVAFHPDYHLAGRHIYGSGMLSVYANAGNNLLSLALFYLSAMNGEAGHNCPVACTAGLIKVLQAVGSQSLREKFLPRLLNADYDTHWHGAQFLTEVQGGSDVGANASRATLIDAEANTWRLDGEKWFCSNVTADLALVTARVEGQGDGTRGLGLFLLPRRLDDGSPNHIFIHRLKDKLGTRSMATAEVELRGALAHAVGPVERGFNNVMLHVINTSRIYNAVAAIGNARRAYLTAWTYAQYRAAFGAPIRALPLVQDLLAKMRADVCAMLSGTLTIISLLDDVELGKGDSAAQGNAETEAFLRLAINLNKYRTAVMAHEVILQGIELLGGNGAIETFSVLPRLLRDNVVYENWEGTHNVLLAQAQRDIRRFGLQSVFFERLRHAFERIESEPLQELRARGLKQTDLLARELDDLLKTDELHASVFFRPLMEKVTDLFYVACLASEAEWLAGNSEHNARREIADFYLTRRVEKREARDIPDYLKQIGTLSSTL